MNGAVVGKGRRLLAVAHLLEVVLPAVRLVIFARLMPSEEFGLAVVLTLIFSAAELLTDFGLQQGILRADPHNPNTLRTYHSMGLLRAVGVGTGIILLAPLTGWLFSQPNQWLTFAAPGVLFALRGLVSLAPRLAARDLDFTPDALVMIATQLVWTLAALAAALVLSNHLAALIGIAAAVMTQIAFSNFVSPSRFSLGWDGRIAHEAWQFGYPLLPNGVALAVTSSADRMLIGALLGIQQLAIYTPIIMLAMLPRGTTVRYLSNIFTPLFISNLNNKFVFDRFFNAWSSALALFGLIFALGIMIFSSLVIGLFLGQAYLPSRYTIILISILIFIRMIIVLPVPVSLASGQTSFITWGSVSTSASMLPAGFILWITEKIEFFLFAMICAEALSFVWIVVRLSRTLRINIKSIFLQFVFCATMLSIATTIAWYQILSPVGFALLATSLALVALIFLRIDKVIGAILSNNVRHPTSD